MTRCSDDPIIRRSDDPMTRPILSIHITSTTNEFQCSILNAGGCQPDLLSGRTIKAQAIARAIAMTEKIESNGSLGHLTRTPSIGATLAPAFRASFLREARQL